MYHIEYATLNYYHSPISDECLCLVILFYTATKDQRDFEYISNFWRFRSFNEEDIDLAKSQRLNGNEEKKLIRRVLESNNIQYSTQKICGPFKDEIALFTNCLFNIDSNSAILVRSSVS